MVTSSQTTPPSSWPLFSLTVEKLEGFPLVHPTLTALPPGKRPGNPTPSFPGHLPMAPKEGHLASCLISQLHQVISVKAIKFSHSLLPQAMLIFICRKPPAHKCKGCHSGSSNVIPEVLWRIITSGLAVVPQDNQLPLESDVPLSLFYSYMHIHRVNLVLKLQRRSFNKGIPTSGLVTRHILLLISEENFLSFTPKPCRLF